MIQREEWKQTLTLPSTNFKEEIHWGMFIQPIMSIYVLCPTHGNAGHNSTHSFPFTYLGRERSCGALWSKKKLRLRYEEEENKIQSFELGPEARQSWELLAPAIKKYVKRKLFLNKDKSSYIHGYILLLKECCAFSIHVNKDL